MRHIAFFIPSMVGGGAERVVVNLLKGMLSKDVSLDLVLASATGAYMNQIPPQVRIVNLDCQRVIKAILPLSRYLRENKPNVLISHLCHANVIAALAKLLALTDTKIILVEHDTLSVSESEVFRARFVPPLMKLLYPRADKIVGVSEAVSRDLETELGLKKGIVQTIYNPVVNRELIDKAKAPLDHPWLQPNSPPVFIAVGRLTLKKDFATLIKAFANLRQKVAVRLIILGEGELRPELETITNNLGIANDVSMPGFVKNPYAYMSRASAFILSSLWEGLPTVLIEAMACGCPVISTDCPSGPKEILAEGKYGELVPMSDVMALSSAMLRVLESPISKEFSTQRAMYFSFERATSQYAALSESV
ncbi:glycosyltransferase [Rivularia sp. PCC 7116]|uniref:glycosyltransferase n=1 Tax=Rivularia sp. PCC 7116 TaxID=373994 RepID=UPI00029EFC7C|nr:glycosyltransferase [Rivularia sp. PCC 7116]AFY52858.1 glycosyltransferase [Rivularia sp. PCC 7116]